jgi:hypothetical protein
MHTTLDDDQDAKKNVGVPQGVTVDVTPIFGNGTVCQIDAGDGPSHSFVHGGVINLHGNPSFDVTWQLQPGDSPGLGFDTANPIWSSQAGCPSGSCQDAQITVQSCSGTTLITTITPQRPPNAVHVSLGWSNGNRFDPIIINN